MSPPLLQHTMLESLEFWILDRKNLSSSAYYYCFFVLNYYGAYKKFSCIIERLNVLENKLINFSTTLSSSPITINIIIYSITCIIRPLLHSIYLYVWLALSTILNYWKISFLINFIHNLGKSIGKLLFVERILFCIKQESISTYGT